jgi:hypothetical protein
MTAAFASDAEHLAAELAVLDLALLREAVRARRAAGHPADERGLYVSDDELQALLARPLAAPLWHSVPPDGELAHLDTLLAERRAELAARLAATAAPLRLEHLVRALAEPSTDVTTPGRSPLTEIHTSADPSTTEAAPGPPPLDPATLKSLVLLALAPELDLRYERIFGWLHDDVTRRHPSVQLALDLLAPGPADRLALLPRFAAHGVLRRRALLHTHAPPHTPLLRHELRLAPGLLAWLSGQPSIPASPLVARAAPPPRLRLAPAQQSALARLRARVARGEPLLVNLHGPDGAGRRSLAAALCGERPLYVVDGARSETLTDDEFTDLLANLARAARLERAGVCWTAFDRQRPALPDLAAVDLLCLVTARPWHPPDPPHTTLAELHVPVADLATREVLWHDVLPALPAAAVRAAADNFRFTPRQIAAAASTARGLADEMGREDPLLPELLLACRRHATPRLGALAAPVTTRRRWHDLVLPDEPRQQLREIVRRLQQRTRVQDEWGFGAVASPGVAALFAGAPGTGKTMAAAIVAAECARDLYRIDLSQVVSKYIGETEKHLETLFSEAESSDAALFFDEADAIFGKRGAIKDAHDRFANIEVGFLLQRIESFPGLVILATNLRKNIDAAFLRRLQVIVEFPTPDLASRAAIWAATWPPGAPVANDVDPRLLAERFDLSGGHIRNIALSAAYAAAEADSPISLRHVLDAARVEYRKLDKLMPDAAFTPP